MRKKIIRHYIRTSGTTLEHPTLQQGQFERQASVKGPFAPRFRAHEDAARVKRARALARVRHGQR